MKSNQTHTILRGYKSAELGSIFQLPEINTLE